MYEFHYGYIKNKYNNKSELLFTDSRILMYETNIEDFYKDFSSDNEMFDFANYSTKPKQYNNSNKLVICKMKDETGGIAIAEFLGLNFHFLVLMTKIYPRITSQLPELIIKIQLP